MKFKMGGVGRASTGQPLRGLEFLWFVALVLSFHYELPVLELTQFDRANPRLFHLVMISGLFLIFRQAGKKEELSPQYKIWAAIVATYCVCALIWAGFFLPWEYGQFSLFFAANYLVGLVAIFAAAKMSFSQRQKNIIHLAVIAGGVFVGTYALWEYSQDFRFRVSAGKQIRVTEGILLGPLGYTYFHIAMVASLTFSMALIKAVAARQNHLRVIYSIASIVCVWPVFFCGSRIAIITSALVVANILLISRRSKLVVGTLAILVIIIIDIAATESVRRSALSLSRFSEMEEGKVKGVQNDVITRVTLQGYELRLYRNQGILVPFIGAGFGVAPHTIHGKLIYRVGYGIHNCYLFALEQGGLVAFVLFILFLNSIWKGLKSQRRSTIPEDRLFSQGISAFFIALLCALLTGQVFWMVNGTENWTTYLVILLIVATKTSTSPRKGTSDNYSSDEPDVAESTSV